MDLDAYLDRIGYAGPREVCLATLRGLHRTHLLAVPFENLDIHLGNEIVLELPSLFEKIVGRRRGGFCYELNGLFAWALGRLGFDVTLLSARVCHTGGLGPEYDHLALRVGLAEPWLADVGFGDSFLEPPPLLGAPAAAPGGRAYRVVAVAEGHRVERREPGSDDWEGQYSFRPVARNLAEFADRCRWQQTAAESRFVQKLVCSRATATGRVTLSGARLITTTAAGREERTLADPAGWRLALRAEFGIDLSDAELQRLARLLTA